MLHENLLVSHLRVLTLHVLCKDSDLRSKYSHRQLHGPLRSSSAWDTILRSSGFNFKKISRLSRDTIGLYFDLKNSEFSVHECLLKGILLSDRCIRNCKPGPPHFTQSTILVISPLDKQKTWKNVYTIRSPHRHKGSPVCLSKTTTLVINSLQSIKYRTVM